jgi:hypothetical protein
VDEAKSGSAQIVAINAIQCDTSAERQRSLQRRRSTHRHNSAHLSNLPKVEMGDIQDSFPVGQIPPTANPTAPQETWSSKTGTGGIAPVSSVISLEYPKLAAKAILTNNEYLQSLFPKWGWQFQIFAGYDIVPENCKIEPNGSNRFQGIILDV